MKTEQIQYKIPTSLVTGVYKITHTPSGYYYIGSTTDFRGRYRCHLRELRKNKHTNAILQNRFNKYSTDWVYELVESCENRDTLEVEQKYINVHANRDLCMNINHLATKPPSPKGRIVSEATREKLRQLKKGKPLTAQHRQALSDAWKTRVMTPESRIRMAHGGPKRSKI